MTSEVPGNIDRLAVRGAEDEFVLAREFNTPKPLMVDAADVVEGDDAGTSVGKGDLDTVRKDARGVYEPVGNPINDSLLPSRGLFGEAIDGQGIGRFALCRALDASCDLLGEDFVSAGVTDEGGDIFDHEEAVTPAGAEHDRFVLVNPFVA